jgi:predicted mannosyl-3-phosphoglycerate phosphatase (HAD superfamily)
MTLPLTSHVVYIAVDGFLSPRGKPLYGFDAFCYALAEENLPCVWATRRSRLEIDDARRKLGQDGPFLAEGGCGVYLPQDYFHLKPAKKTVRLGRFTCIPLADRQPAARDALTTLAGETGMDVVPLRSLSPRELAQNTGLPQHEAEMLLHRDFDELFFFAGASSQDFERVTAEARRRGLALRPHGAFWSLAIGANAREGIRELGSLYERALRRRPVNFGVSAQDGAELVASCERQVLLRDAPSDVSHTNAPGRGVTFSLQNPAVWDDVLSELRPRSRR